MCNSELKPHVHAQQIKAWADGHTIEYWCRFSNQWTVEVDPAWALDAKYRIKPEQSDFEKYGVEVGDAWSMKSVTWGYFVVKKSATSLLITALFEEVVTEVPYKELNTLLFRRGVVDKLGSGL